ncbi:MAG: hypothetical protein ABSC72_04685 [Methylovirgula sp.]
MTNLTLGTASEKSHAIAKEPQQATAPLWLLIAIALGLGLVLSYSRALDVWHKGTFFDSDDAMRLVQVRSLLHGQAWFDLTAYRLDPPAGVFMHWSRLIDLPLVILIKLFSLVLAPDLAERAARIVFPLGLQALLYVGMARLAKIVIGPAAILPVLVLTLLSGMEVGQFQPGRIHHSAPQIMLTIFMIGCMADAVDPKKARLAAIAGVLAALSLAIGLETLPFVVVLAALAVALWIAQGDAMRPMLGAFALGLGMALPLFFFVTVGPAHWFDTVCDAYSIAYLVPGLAGAAALLSLAVFTSRLQTRVTRALAAAGAGALVVAAACAIKPICFVDPYHGIDPLVRQIWLNNVIEGFSLRRLYAQDAGAAIMLILPIALGLAATLVAWRKATGLDRRRWLILAVTSIAAAALSFWMIRMLSFAILISSFGGAWCILAARAGLTKTRWREASALAFCFVLPFSTVGWAIVIPGKSDGADWKEGTGCLTTSAFAPLAQLSPGLVAGPIDAGSHMLAFTPHSVLAAPYHRDNDGNRAEIDAMLAPPDKARDIFAAHHVTYVMTCAGLKETEVMAQRAPHGLAAALIGGRVPNWLKPLPGSGPYHVFVIQP